MEILLIHCIRTLHVLRKEMMNYIKDTYYGCLTGIYLSATCFFRMVANYRTLELNFFGYKVLSLFCDANSSIFALLFWSEFQHNSIYCSIPLEFPGKCQNCVVTTIAI